MMQLSSVVVVLLGLTSTSYPVVQSIKYRHGYDQLNDDSPTCQNDAQYRIFNRFRKGSASHEIHEENEYTGKLGYQQEEVLRRITNEEASMLKKPMSFLKKVGRGLTRLNKPLNWSYLKTVPPVNTGKKIQGHSFENSVIERQAGLSSSAHKKRLLAYKKGLTAILSHKFLQLHVEHVRGSHERYNSNLAEDSEGDYSDLKPGMSVAESIPGLTEIDFPKNKEDSNEITEWKRINHVSHLGAKDIARRLALVHSTLAVDYKKHDFSRMLKSDFFRQTAAQNRQLGGRQLVHKEMHVDTPECIRVSYFMWILPDEKHGFIVDRVDSIKLELDYAEDSDYVDYFGGWGKDADYKSKITKRKSNQAKEAAEKVIEYRELVSKAQGSEMVDDEKAQGSEMVDDESDIIDESHTHGSI